jgi:hypothetical protein
MGKRFAQDWISLCSDSVIQPILPRRSLSSRSRITYGPDIELQSGGSSGFSLPTSNHHSRKFLYFFSESGIIEMGLPPTAIQRRYGGSNIWLACSSLKNFQPNLPISRLSGNVFGASRQSPSNGTHHSGEAYLSIGPVPIAIARFVRIWPRVGPTECLTRLLRRLP